MNLRVLSVYHFNAIVGTVLALSINVHLLSAHTARSISIRLSWTYCSGDSPIACRRHYPQPRAILGALALILRQLNLLLRLHALFLRGGFDSLVLDGIGRIRTAHGHRDELHRQSLGVQVGRHTRFDFGVNGIDGSRAYRDLIHAAFADRLAHQLREFLLDVVLVPVGTEVLDQHHSVSDLQINDGVEAQRDTVCAHGVGKLLLISLRLHIHVHAVGGDCAIRPARRHRLRFYAAMPEEEWLADQHDLMTGIGRIDAAP